MSLRELSQLPNIHQIAEYEAIVGRIIALTPNHQALWGKMNVAQMMSHCRLALASPLEATPQKQAFLGKILAPFMKKRHLDANPLARNTPTAKRLIVVDTDVFEKEQAKLLYTLKQFYDKGYVGLDGKVSPFFGALTGLEWSRLHYKHLQHHFTQFGAW